MSTHNVIDYKNLKYYNIYMKQTRKDKWFSTRLQVFEENVNLIMNDFDLFMHIKQHQTQIKKQGNYKH